MDRFGRWRGCGARRHGLRRCPHRDRQLHAVRRRRNCRRPLVPPASGRCAPRSPRRQPRDLGHLQLPRPANRRRRVGRERLTGPSGLEAVLATPRLRARWTDAVTILRSFALVTFDVDPAALAVVLPSELAPEVRRLDDGRDRAFVSAVSFRDIDFRFRGAAAIKGIVRPDQLPRLRVRARWRTRGVLLRARPSISRLAVIPRRLWGMPWDGGRTTIDATWDGTRCLAYRHRCAGGRNGVDAAFTGTDVSAGRLGWLPRRGGCRDRPDASARRILPAAGWGAWAGNRRGTPASDRRSGRLFARGMWCSSGSASSGRRPCRTRCCCNRRSSSTSTSRRRARAPFAGRSRSCAGRRATSPRAAPHQRARPHPSGRCGRTHATGRSRESPSR